MVGMLLNLGSGCGFSNGLGPLMSGCLENVLFIKVFGEL